MTETGKNAPFPQYLVRTLRNLRDLAVGFLLDLDAARAAAAAIRVRAQPRSADLRRLGIDAAAFRRIRRF